MYLGVSHASHPKGAEFQGYALWAAAGSPVFMPTPFNAERPNSGMVTHMGMGVLGGQPRHGICTNASRGLSVIAVLPVLPASSI